MGLLRRYFYLFIAFSLSHRVSLTFHCVIDILNHLSCLFPFIHPPQLTSSMHQLHLVGPPIAPVMVLHLCGPLGGLVA